MPTETAARPKWWAGEGYSDAQMEEYQAKFQQEQRNLVLYVIRRKQFEVIGRQLPSNDFFHTLRWWDAHKWTPEQESQFKAFLAEYLRRYKPARLVLGMSEKKRLTKPDFEKAAEEYCSQFGWKGGSR